MSTVLNLTVAASEDDCYVDWHNGAAWVFAFTTLRQMVGYYGSASYKRGGGMRFLNATIPKGATIDTAYLTLQAMDSNAVDTVNSKISGEAADNPITFSNLADYQARAKTTTVNWNAIDDWTADADYNSPEIKTIIQEIVNRAGWASGNALVLFWDDHDDLSSHNAQCVRMAKSYNTDTTYCARLHIEYTPPAVAGRSHGYIIG